MDANRISACRIAVVQLVAAAAAIDVEALREIKLRLDRADAIGCIFDPTAWMREAKARNVSLQWANATLAFINSLQPSGTPR